VAALPIEVSYLRDEHLRAIGDAGEVHREASALRSYTSSGYARIISRDRRRERELGILYRDGTDALRWIGSRCLGDRREHESAFRIVNCTRNVLIEISRIVVRCRACRASPLIIRSCGLENTIAGTRTAGADFLGNVLYLKGTGKAFREANT